MLEFYFKSPKRLEQLRSGPLAEHIAELAAKLYRRGFTRATGQRILSLTGRFNGFAAGAGVEDGAGIDDALAERFINEELRAEGAFRDAGSLLRHMLDHLRFEGVIQQAAATRSEDRFASVLGKYDRYLDCVRGLSLSSRPQYLRYAQRLLEWACERHGERPLAHLTGVDVLDFITESAGLNPSGSWRCNLCSLTRVFLRYLRWEGIVEVDLDRVVPTLPHWRLQSIPRHLPWAQVRALVDSVDTSTPLGLRDKAVLLLIATLGLRNQEVRHLKLTEIHWRVGEIRLAKTKSRRERALPLLQELGSALAEYVLRGRPRLDVPHVFVRHRAPLGPITSTHGIGDIVRRHLLRARIPAPSQGAHLLRHSLATRMVNQGVEVKQIADLLGHASIDSTAIYTKVDMSNLSAVALPFPGGDA
jgi:site-specific recombinase XerD